MEAGIPSLHIQKTVTIDGVSGIANPLHSYILPRDIPMPHVGDDANSKAKYYVKPRGYETKRYPFSGIVNPPSARQAASIHNAALMRQHKTPEMLLAENLKN